MTHAEMKKKYTVNLFKIIWLPIVILIISFIILTLINSQLYKMQDGRELKNTVSALIKNHEGYFANEIFLNERAALKKRVNLVIEKSLMNYPDGVICIRIIPKYRTDITKPIIQCSNKKYLHEFLSGNAYITRNFSIGHTAIVSFEYWAFMQSKLSCYLPFRLLFSMLLSILISLIAFYFLVKKIHQSAIDPLVKHIEQNTREKALSELAVQVAHDIRSPLSALQTVLKELPEVSEQKRILIRNATRRISDIANNLLSHYRSDNRKNNTDMTIHAELVSSLIDSLVSEIRAQLENDRIDFQFSQQVNAYGCFVKLDINHFKRMISNLVNNAIEAIRESGTVRIILTRNENYLVLKIIDTGIGIPTELLPLIRKGGVSVGKKGGLGLGISSAIRNIEQWGGHFDIQSVVNQGTTVNIELPIADEPNWFQHDVSTFPEMHLIVLDDDVSIHDVWTMRFRKLISHHQLVLEHFYKDEAFLEYYEQHRSDKNLFFIDYELLGSKKNGLELIEELNIQDASILVTSQYESNKIRTRAIQLGIKIIPKNFAPYVPINVIETQPEMIFIDDSVSLTMALQQQANLMERNILTFNHIADFKKVVTYFNHEIPIYIDSHLGEHVKGEEFAKELYDQGFKNLYLLTGYDTRQFEKMPWIKMIINKDTSFFD